MKHFDFYCPLCNQKLKVPFVNNGEISNCPFCDGEIVPTYDDKVIQQIEQQELENERKSKVQEALEQAERERKAREKEKKSNIKSMYCVDMGILNYLKEDTFLITILKIVIVVNAIAGVICFMASIGLKEPLLFCAAIALAIESAILYGIIKFLELIQQHFINTFWIKKHLAEISHKLDK